MSSPSKRRDIDVMKLMMSDYVVETTDDKINEFIVDFHGPKESYYEGGVWKIRVKLPDINELTGGVCLDVINQSWSPMFDLFNVFEVFLPQLLLYPNPSHPLNREAARLMIKEPKQYEQKVKEYCERYAKKETVTTENDDEEEEISDEDVSDVESVSSEEDNDSAGRADR